jgi:hypothetical protein
MESLNIDTSENLANDNTLKFDNFKDFFANKISYILENKGSSIIYAAALATAITATTELSKNNQIKQESSIPISHNIIETQTLDNTEIDIPDTLGFVDVKNLRYKLDVEEILRQSKKYYLNVEILEKAVEKNEIWSLEFVDYLPEENFNTNTSKYTYQQIGEALGDLKTIEYLLEQQQLSEKDKIASQRIFNTLLMSKLKIITKGSKKFIYKWEYDLIHAAADYNYQFVSWEKYDKSWMTAVMHKIDSWDYDENMLIQYAEELKRSIEIDAWFDMNTYQAYLSSQWKTQFIAHNRI